jgi:hypothetical protein
MAMEILLTKSKVAIVDDCDFEWLNQWCWRARCGYQKTATWYALRHGPRNHYARRTLLMHREIAALYSDIIGFDVDHRDGDGLNNRRSNLRVATHQQNRCNQRKSARPMSSPFKGVHLHRGSGKWRAQVRVDGKVKLLGAFGSEMEAALVYDNAARALYGEFATLNFPVGMERAAI